VKYRPQRNCSLSYRLRLRDAGGHSLPDQHVAARLCPGDGAGRAQRAARAPSQASAAGPSVHWLPALDMLTWWWPNDAKLTAPRVLADAALCRQAVLPELVVALGGRELQAHELAVVQYVPEQRLCARLDLRWRDGHGAQAGRYYAKASREPATGQAHALLQALQQSPAGRSGRLHTPAAVLWQPQFDLHWQQGLPGRALLDLPAAEAAALAPALGRQLALLHGCGVALPRTLTPDALRLRLADVVALLADALPATRGALLATAARLSDGLAFLQGHAMATLHGDLHPRNVLADGARLFLIDLDGSCSGPALLELGSWLADGVFRALLDDAPAARDAPAWQALLASYADAGGRAPEPRALAWACAWHLLTERAWRCVVNLKPGRYALAPRLVASAGRLADTLDLEMM
jgi:thiamine kinase-like enzyme